MRFPAKVLVGFVLVFILSVSSYMTIVEAAAAMRSASMVNSFSVESLRHASSARSFSIGDTLVIEAESDVACGYDLRVSDNSSVVYEARSPGGSPVKMEVPLLPPAFKAGSPYTLSLNCFAVNTPLPGAFSVDSASYTFDVSGTQTTLSLFSVYDDQMNWLYASANLTDADGYAVANETVGFYLQLKSQRSLTDGWIPLGTSLTDDNGTATITSGFPLLYNMAVKTCLDGDANYGACENITDVQVITGFIQDHLYQAYETGGAGQTGGIPLTAGNVSISMDMNCTYYHMSPNVTVQYTSNSQLTGLLENLTIFYLDNFLFRRGIGEHGSQAWESTVRLPGLVVLARRPERSWRAQPHRGHSPSNYWSRDSQGYTEWDGDNRVRKQTA
jgi:hypothetical protein